MIFLLDSAGLVCLQSTVQSATCESCDMGKVSFPVCTLASPPANSK